MRFCLFCPYVPTTQLPDIAQSAEELGFHAVTISDHVVYPSESEGGYPYTDTGSPAFADITEWPDPFVWASAALAVTREISVLTSIVVLPMRDPLLVAKGVATLSALSPGRIMVGVGVGWWREEFEILGADFDTRGPRTDEGIEIMRLLWRGEPASYEGRFRSFPELMMLPVPQTEIPIYAGGASRVALRRAALLCDGIIPPRGSQPQTAEHLETITRLRSEHGRTGQFDYIAPAAMCASPSEIEDIDRLGIQSVHVDPIGLYTGVINTPGNLTLDDRRRAIERFAREVIQPING